MFVQPLVPRFEAQDFADSEPSVLARAYSGYAAVLASTSAAEDQLDPQTFQAEYEKRMNGDILSYIETTQQANPDLKYFLQATPDIQLEADEVEGLVMDFGSTQPSPSRISKKLFDHYTGYELTHADKAGQVAVRFSLVPSVFRTSGLRGTVPELRTKLARLQEDHSFLKAPSVLDGITGWHTLRGEHPQLIGDDVADASYVSHFDLPEYYEYGGPRVICSFVAPTGKPYIFFVDGGPQPAKLKISF